MEINFTQGRELHCEKTIGFAVLLRRGIRRATSPTERGKCAVQNMGAAVFVWVDAHIDPCHSLFP